MKSVRFSVKAFLAAIALIAAAFGALESRSTMVASLVFTLNVAALCFAFVGAWVGSGNARKFWTGFVVFGGVYLLTAFGILLPMQSSSPYMWMGYARADDRPELFTTRLLDWYSQLRVRLAVGERVTAQWSGGGYWPATIVAYRDGRYEVDWDDSSPNEWVRPTQMQPVGRDLHRVGHSVFSLLFGLLGGWAAVWAFGHRSTAGETSPAASQPASRAH